MAEGGGQVVGRRSERARYDACELETQSSLGPSHQAVNLGGTPHQTPAFTLTTIT